MSKMVQTDDIDELVSSVRDFVSHKEPMRTRSRILMDRLILTPEQRVPADEIAKTSTNTGLSDHRSVAHLRPLPPVQSFDKAGLEATIAELEAAVTSQFDEWEPDEGESFAKAAWAASAFQKPQVESQETPEASSEMTKAAQLRDVLQPQLEGRQDTAVAEPVDDKKALTASVMDGLDDAALRSLVIEIVHDELGGELGERITRNVRKLVRREINRVLTSRAMGQD